MILWIFFNGILLGMANVIPGLSGGTLLLLTGMYPRFIDVFGSLNIRSLKAYQWKKNIIFIMIIAIGALLSIFAMSKIMSWLLETHPVPVYLLLIGLIIGSFDLIIKQINFKSSSSRYAVIAGIALIVFIILLSRILTQPLTTTDDTNVFLLISAGALAAATMVLPGVSGSMLLLLLGLYRLVVESVAALNLINIFFIGIGAIVGILFASRLIKGLLEKHASATYAFLFGLILASMMDLFPISMFEKISSVIIGIIALIFGIILGKGLKRLEKNYSEEKK